MRKTVSVQLDMELLERLKNAVYWTPGLTVRDVIELGVRLKLKRLEKSFGQEFPQRLTEIKAGRKIE